MITKKRLFLAFICYFILFNFNIVWAETLTRKPSVAGSFYPDKPANLIKLVNSYLNKVPEQSINGDIKVVISPHAGYIYSGPVAAYGYKTIQGKNYDAVVVLALSHFYPFRGASVFDGNYYETPLGKVAIDRESVSIIKESSDLIDFYPLGHKKEHSLEVQIPFLQVVLGNNIKLIPIVFGDTSYETARSVAEVLARISDKKNILVVATTDLSHYDPYNIAQKKDLETIEEITKMSSQGLQSYFDQKTDRACGKCPLVTALIFADLIKANNISILKYANSGDTAGNKNRVVGYVSMVITKQGETHMKPAGENQEFSEKSKQELFSIVRNTVRGQLTEGKVSPVESSNPQLQSQNGVFVTLHTKGGALRGCIGCFTSNKPLFKTVQEMALSSAFRDPRFPPVTLDELDNLHVEISVLSPMKKINDVNEIQLGKHGIYIKKGFNSGTFLPQVATDTGWSLEEFLGHCSRDKAGLGWEGWKNADIFTYTADVFGEKKK